MEKYVVYIYSRCCRSLLQVPLSTKDDVDLLSNEKTQSGSFLCYPQLRGVGALCSVDHELMAERQQRFGNPSHAVNCYVS